MFDILLVDDEEKIRNGIKNNFPWEQMGYTISREAACGEQALEMIRRRCPDVVLTDIVMPGMSGIELAKRIYDAHFKTRIVFLSGYQEFDYARQALAFDVYRYLLKPVDREELTAVFTSLHGIIAQSAAAARADGEAAPAKSAYEQLMLDVKQYALDNLASVTLNSAALHVALSISHLSRMFKAQCGVSFSEWLLRAKMERAGEMLLDHRKMVYEISEAVGYDSAKNFTRAFKRCYGKTPHEYRLAPSGMLCAQEDGDEA